MRKPRRLISRARGTVVPTVAQEGSGCGPGQTRYTSIRLGYAKNGNAVTFVHDESWTWDGVSACPTNYTKTWAREFRYDGARARYMNRPLDVNTLGLNPQPHPTQPTIWSDYDGDKVYGDFEMVSGSPVNKRSFEPRIGRTTNPLTTPVTNYYHGDMLGTTRLMSNASGSSIEPAVYTAFGEPISTPSVTDPTRYGYAGAWGYQAHADFPYLHVGARYYDPSSGRFLQRDPIGILGGVNVYEYVDSAPLMTVDPNGLFSWIDWGFKQAKRVVVKIADILTGQKTPPISAPLITSVSALGCVPDLARIKIGVDHRRTTLLEDNGDDINDAMDKYEQKHDQRVKPGSGAG